MNLIQNVLYIVMCFLITLFDHKSNLSVLMIVKLTKRSYVGKLLKIYTGIYIYIYIYIHVYIYNYIQKRHIIIADLNIQLSCGAVPNPAIGCGIKVHSYY